MDDLTVLFQKDLCKIIKKFKCKNVSSSEIYGEGLVGIIQQVVNIIVANEKIIETDIVDENLFKHFIESKEFQMYFLDAFEVANEAMR